VIQNLRANLHPKLESYPDSCCPELKLAPMRVGVRGPLRKVGLVDRPPHPKPSASTSPRKRGEVN
jgi:hypothetical protein